MRNDVLENYIKIARENGKRKTETPTTADLYKKQDKKNIIEQAHPESAVIQNSYDSIHGLVENLNERRNILLNIVNKSPDGQLANKKYSGYSETKLLLNLAKVANTTSDPEIKKLAEACKYQIEKKAFWWWVAGASAFIGLIYAQQHMPSIARGIEIDYKTLNESLDNVLDTNDPNPIFYGQKWSTELLRTVSDLKKTSYTLYSKFKQLESFVSRLKKPENGAALIKSLEDKELDESVQKSFKEFEDLRASLIPEYQVLTSRFQDNSFKITQMVDQGFLSKLFDQTRLHGGKALIQDKLDEVSKNLDAFTRSTEAVTKLSIQASSISTSVASKVESKENKPEKPVDQPKPEKTDQVVPGTTKLPKSKPQQKTKPQRSLSDIAKEIHFGEPPSFE